MTELEFDEDHPDFEDIRARMRQHSRMGPAPARDWLAEGLLARRELSTIFGGPGETKSALAIDVACRLAAGIHWDGSALPFRRNVLYIAAERPDQVRRRVSAFCKYHNIAPLEDLMIYDGTLDLSVECDQLSNILDAARWTFDGSRPDLTVIDTLAAAMSKPASDTGATNAAARNLVRAVRGRDEYDASHIMLVHHTPLSDPSRMAGGHVNAAMDVTLLVKKTRAGSVARVTKNNGSPEPWPGLNYSLTSVDVVCEDGTTVSEPVVVPTTTEFADVGRFKPTPKGQRLAALTALQQVAPASTAVWRAKFRAGEPDATAAATKVGFRRASTWLSEKGYALLDGELWRPAEQVGEHSGEQEQESE